MNHFKADPVPNYIGDLGEGILWDERTSRLIWVDVFARRIHYLAPKTGEIVGRSFTSILTSIAKKWGGGYVVAAGDRLLELDGDLREVRQISLQMGNENVRTNDGNVDPNGDYWIGSMAYDAKPNQGNLKWISSNYDENIFLKDVTIANGIDWSPDGEIMYFIDTPKRQIGRFNWKSKDKSKESARESELKAIDLTQFAGVPDGMCVDKDGGLWVAFWGDGKIRNFSPEGDLIGQVIIPASLVTNCAFGGEDLSTLYITTANSSYESSIEVAEPLSGSLFQVSVNASGRAQNDFGKQSSF
jgi:sugar lactone lactonase YvrE